MPKMKTKTMIPGTMVRVTQWRRTGTKRTGMERTEMNRTTGVAQAVLSAALAAAASIGFADRINAQSPAEVRGREIAAEADLRDFGWGDNSSTMRMVLRNRNGDESIRELHRQALETEEAGFGDKSVITFDAPRDVAGTSLLSHTRILDPDDQWIFLPALRRVKRISSSNKSGPFVGSEFAFEDLVSQELDKYDYRFLGEDTCGELECYMVERTPLYEDSGYTKQVIWWDTVEYRVQRIDYYDRRDALLKTLMYQGYQQYIGEYWRPDLMAMENHQNGKTTDLQFSEWTFANGLTEGEFTPSRLRRGR
jgi:outer membrane lipoprotein-sorting protein